MRACTLPPHGALTNSILKLENAFRSRLHSLCGRPILLFQGCNRKALLSL